MRGRSLKPTQSMIWYMALVHKWKLFNKARRQHNLPQLSFDWYCICRGFDMSGKELIDVNVMP